MKYIWYWYEKCESALLTAGLKLVSTRPPSKQAQLQTSRRDSTLLVCSFLINKFFLFNCQDLVSIHLLTPNTKLHVEISLIWNCKIFILNKILLKICGITIIFSIMCYYKNEDASTVDKSTSEPVISNGSVYIKIII